MKFELTLGDQDEKLRKAFRTRVPGLSIRIVKTGQVYPVKDISATGFAILDEERVFKEGMPIDVDILLGSKLFLGQVAAKVMRVLQNCIVGCNFMGMDRRQEAKLDKLVLEVQKRLIELRKAQKEEA